MAKLSTIRADRERLRTKWRAQGFHGSKTLSDAIFEGLQKFPDTRSFYYRDDVEQVYTNEELHERALYLASALLRLNVTAGDVIAVQLPTWVEASIIYQAAAHLGVVTLPIISIYGKSEVSHIIKQSRAKILFVPSSWRGRDYVREYEFLHEESALERIVEVGERSTGRSMTWAELNTIASPVFEPTRACADDVCTLIYTSGTTSSPKGVKHTHNSLLWEWNRPIFADRGMYLSNMPAGHITGYGFMLRPTLLGASQVFMDHWNPRLAAALIQKHRVQSGGGTPHFLLTLLEAAGETGADISSLQNFSMGGQGISPEQVRMADEMGFSGARVYGSTEHPTVTSFQPGDSFESRAYSDGGIDRGNEVRIVDDDDTDLAAGEEGNILTRGPDMFSGYFDELLDEHAFTDGGWYRTGDIGKIDERGRLHITDRKKDIIIRGGENISSLEVEACLLKYPAIREAAAVAMPDPAYGEKVCAFVVIEPGVDLSLEDIRSHFKRSGMAIQKSPERLEILTELPKNSSGKTLKPQLRSILIKECQR